MQLPPADADLHSQFRLPVWRQRYFQTSREVIYVELATETEVEDLFPDRERGAMPPFGNLYDMDVYVAEQLTEDEEVAFGAGSHTEVVRMSYKDFDTLVMPKITAPT